MWPLHYEYAKKGKEGVREGGRGTYRTSQAMRVPSSVAQRRVEGEWGHQLTHSGSVCREEEREERTTNV